MEIAQEDQWLSQLKRAFPAVSRVLVLAPHPDDEVFGCGGAICLLREAGTAVSIHILTDGALGGNGPDLPEIRAEESRAALHELGSPEAIFHGFPDRGLVYGEKLIVFLTDLILETNAELVFLPAPTEIHPDHQSLALAGAEALRRLKGERKAAFYEVGIPLPIPNLLIDITAAAERKRLAMACFESQAAMQPYVERIFGLNGFRALYLGAPAQSAEAFVLAGASEMNQTLAALFSGLPAYRRRLGFASSPEDIPLVSIVVRSMDRPLLAAALDSLALQTYGHLEVVVVNAKGGEHSSLGEWCGNYPLKLINQGGEPLSRGRAANAGLAVCRGFYLGFLDDDDAFDPDHISCLVAVLQKSSVETVAYAGVRGLRRDDPEGAVLATFAETEASFAKLLLGNFLPIHAVLFPASLLERGLMFDETLPVYEDWDFWLQAARLVPFVAANRVTASYFHGGKSGVSPLHADRDAVRKARRRLFSKWLGLLSPHEWAAIADYHHHVRSELLAQRHEAQRLGAERGDLLRQSEERLRQSEIRSETFEERLRGTARDLAARDNQLMEIFSSRSWRMTHLLRKLGGFFRGPGGKSVL